LNDIGIRRKIVYSVLIAKFVAKSPKQNEGRALKTLQAQRQIGTFGKIQRSLNVREELFIANLWARMMLYSTNRKGNKHDT
jgi:hypothetical protein